MLGKKRNIIFLTGTRADFGKLKSLIKITQEDANFNVQIFATGMHLDVKYGLTVNEIYKSGFKNIAKFQNYVGPEHMDRTLAKTILGFSEYVAAQEPDLVVVHGDRVEALAGAIVGSLNNILVAHIEGGELSGTIDELIRHSVSKLSHLHLVSNSIAKNRLVQMGELASSIFTIGSPDLDLMNPSTLPKLEVVKTYYNIVFKQYAIAIFHPVTTEYHSIQEQSAIFVDALISSNKNYIIIYPNNDLGTDEILQQYKRLEGISSIIIFPSLRFEYFLRLLKDATFIIGNSSVGIREAPFYNIPTINLGSRQKNRYLGKTVKNIPFNKVDILDAIHQVNKPITKEVVLTEFGLGNSNQQFLELLKSEKIWQVDCQKQFQDL